MKYELDCCGLVCPEPVVRCRKLIGEQQPKTVIVKVDNAAAKENVLRLLAKSGYEASSETDGKAWIVTGIATEAIESSNKVCACTMPDSATTDSSQKTLILLTTSTLGHGDDELGARLMENFLATLPEMRESLWRVVLLNGGVKLAALPGKALDSLKALEADGVSILVCGACLTFYNLLESKQVGETTNMLDVVTSLDLADKVIRP